MAVTLNVYEVPGVRPVRVAPLKFPPIVAVIPPGLEVTVYPVIAAPPLEVEFHMTVALVESTVTVCIIGAPGTTTAGAACNVTEFDGGEGLPVLPLPSETVTVNVYGVPCVKLPSFPKICELVYWLLPI